MENRNRDKISKDDHSTTAGDVNRKPSSKIGQSKSDSDVSFDKKTGRSEDLNESSGNGGLGSPTGRNLGSGLGSSSRYSASSGMGGSSGRPGSSSDIDSSGVREDSDRDDVESDTGRSGGSSLGSKNGCH